MAADAATAVVTAADAATNPHLTPYSTRREAGLSGLSFYLQWDGLCDIIKNKI